MLYPPLLDYIKRCKESWATLAERLGKPMCMELRVIQSYLSTLI